MNKPFATTLRPQTLSAVVGQKHLKPLLEKVVAQKEHLSFLLYGVPGIGKTSLAYALCNDLHVSYSYFNAAIGNKKELIALIAINDYLIIDEIHRLNRDKQDILLPALELGHIKVIAPTTENPYFVVNPAVRSRLQILKLEPLKLEDLVQGLKDAIQTQNLPLQISQAQLKLIALNAHGDYRYCLNVLNLLHKLFAKVKITSKILKTVMPSMHFFSDRQGDGHYDLLSAFHKSLRGSDVDAALYYLAYLIKSGDLEGMTRRILAVAYEDVGLADPNLPLRISVAIDTAKKLGFPEARLPLANAVIDLAQAPKSNSAYLAISQASAMIKQGGSLVIPLHLRDSHYQSAAKLNHGVGYKYPHDYGGYVTQQYLPDELVNTKFYVKNKHDKF